MEYSNNYLNTYDMSSIEDMYYHNTNDVIESITLQPDMQYYHQQK